jgi:hypothetical protein
MAGYKVPDFNERAAASRAARQTALDKLRDKPVADPAVIAERQAAKAAREAAATERRAARQREAEEAKAAKLAAKAAAVEAAKPAPPPLPKPPLLDAAALKAERDARYAARKARKR